MFTPFTISQTPCDALWVEMKDRENKIYTNSAAPPFWTCQKLFFPGLSHLKCHFIAFIQHFICISLWRALRMLPSWTFTLVSWLIWGLSIYHPPTKEYHQCEKAVGIKGSCQNCRSKSFNTNVSRPWKDEKAEKKLVVWTGNKTKERFYCPWIKDILQIKLFQRIFYLNQAISLAKYYRLIPMAE